MSVISIIITNSDEEIVSGIPKKIMLETNLPATIFYTLDGSDPTLSSTIYIDPIKMPTDQLSINLKVFASNGVDSSIIITETYFTNILNNLRLPHSATTAQPNDVIKDNYPFGTGPLEPNVQYLNPGNAGITVDDPSKPEVSNGFDADGYAADKSNLPFNFENYDVVYPEGNFINEPLKVGHLPTNVFVKKEKPVPNETNYGGKLFDPRAFVIFQDFATEDETKPPMINKQFFSLEDNNKVRSGNNLFITGLDAPAPTGSFVKQHFNPRDNTITYYYRDSVANRWIISKMPYNPAQNPVNDLSGVVFNRRQRGAFSVFQWYPFNRRHLF